MQPSTVEGSSRCRVRERCGGQSRGAGNRRTPRRQHKGPTEAGEGVTPLRRGGAGVVWAGEEREGVTRSGQVRNGAATETKQMEVTLSADHRHIYGADSAQVQKSDLAGANSRSLLVQTLLGRTGSVGLAKNHRLRTQSRPRDRTRRKWGSHVTSISQKYSIRLWAGGRQLGTHGGESARPAPCCLVPAACGLQPAGTRHEAGSCRRQEPVCGWGGAGRTGHGPPACRHPRAVEACRARAVL